MIPLKQKSPCRSSSAGRGERVMRRSVHPPSRIVQDLAGQFAALWLDAAERFTSALYRALTDAHVPAVRAILADAVRSDLRLGPKQFPSPEHWGLVSLLCGFSECRIRPSIGAILHAGSEAAIDLPGAGGDPSYELSTILECESSAAGLLSWARELQAYARRAVQVGRLWKRLRVYLAEPISEARRPSTPIIVRLARRKTT